MKTKVSFSLGIPAILFTLLIPTDVFAEWYWITEISDPNTGYFIEEISPNTIGYTPTDNTDPYSNKTLVPENFMDTMDETKASDKCSGELDSAIQKLRQFDASEEIVQPSLKCGAECSPYYAYPEQTMASREQLLLNLESDAQSCLADEQKEIEKAIEEQERKEAEEARIIEVQKAVSECDFDYFENEMTNDERMDTWNEREACKKEVAEVNTETTLGTPVIPEVAYVPPTPIVPEVIKPKEESVKTEPIETQVVDTQTEPVTTSSEISTTNEEISKEVEQAEIETEHENQPTQQDKPSIFKRVFNFFFGWFN